MFPLVVHFSHPKNPKVEENRQKIPTLVKLKENWMESPEIGVLAQFFSHLKGLGQALSPSEVYFFSRSQKEILFFPNA